MTRTIPRLGRVAASMMLGCFELACRCLLSVPAGQIVHVHTRCYSGSTGTPADPRRPIRALGGKIVTVDPSDSKPSNLCFAGWAAHSVADACSSLESATRSLPCHGVVGVVANSPRVQLLQLSVEECCADRSRGSAHHGLGGLQTSAQRLGLVRWIPSRCLGRYIGHE